MTTTVQGNLVMVGLHTDDPKVFWNGVAVPGITRIAVANDADTRRVVLHVAEDPVLAEMQAAGVIIKRGA